MACLNRSTPLHFIGIGGYGMSALARVFLERGYQVTGSDIEAKPILEGLRDFGAIITIGHHPENVPEKAIVIYTSDVPKDNVELVVARERKQTIWHRADLLAYLINHEKGIAIAGSHGKTTSSSMIAWMMTEAGWNPTFVIGGEMVNSGTNARSGTSDYVVAEADESDRSFLKYSPYIGAITNIEPDHLEHYDGDFVNMQRAFYQFARQVREGGFLVIGVDDPEARRLVETLNKKNAYPNEDQHASEHDYHKAHQNGARTITIKTYAMTAGYEADVVAKNIMMDGPYASFEAVLEGRSLGRIRLGIPGKHHVMNALLALTVGSILGLPERGMVQSLESFRGAKRRFEKIGEVGGILLVDDYAVHPTEIEATLATARAFGRRVMAVFQPHRATRVYYLQEAFARAFVEVDRVYVTGIYSPRGDVLQKAVDGRDLAAQIGSHSGVWTVYEPHKEALIQHILNDVRPNDLVITLGAGDIRKLAFALREALSEKFERPQPLSDDAAI